uniref:Ras domain containing protein n=1 Tax=Haemonchus contortus TaxID=6289 RepID=A0A7I4Z7M6_HAECO
MEINDHEVAVVEDEPQYAPNRFKILVVGRRGSGKTALIRRLKDNVFSDEEDDPTSATDVTVIVRAVQGSIIKADMVEVDLSTFLACDSPSSQAKVHFVRQYFDVNGLLLLYDITNSDTFEEIDDVLRTLQRMVAPDVDICIVGTKADLMESRKISFEAAEQKSVEHGFSLFETSALTGINCEEALIETLDKLAERRAEVREYWKENTEVCNELSTTNEHEPAESNFFCWIPKFWRRKH